MGLPPAPSFDHVLSGHETAHLTPGETPKIQALSTDPRPDLQQTFTALDSGSQDDLTTGRWLHAGRTRAEAGFDDPSLGWIGVRAELTSSGVHASVVPGSAEAAQSLGAHLSGLSLFLSEHRAPVEALTMTAPELLGNQSMLQGGQGEKHGGEGGASRGETFPRQRRDNDGAPGVQSEPRISANATTIAGPRMVSRRNGSISLIA